MTMLETLFLGLGSLCGASVVASLLVAVICRHIAEAAFMCVVAALVAMCVSTLLFHAGGVF